MAEEACTETLVCNNAPTPRTPAKATAIPDAATFLCLIFIYLLILLSKIILYFFVIFHSYSLSQNIVKFNVGAW